MARKKFNYKGPQAGQNGYVPPVNAADPFYMATRRPTVCRLCGAPLAEDATENLCPACLEQERQKDLKSQRKKGAAAIIWSLLLAGVYVFMLMLGFYFHAVHWLVGLLLASVPGIILLIVLKSAIFGRSRSSSGGNLSLGWYLLLFVGMIILGIVLTPIMVLVGVIRGAKQIKRAKAEA